MKKYLFLLLLLCMIQTFVHAQKELIDSLIHELPKAKEDTNKVNLLLDISFYSAAQSPDDAIKYATQGRDLSQKLNYPSGIAGGNRNIGIGYVTKSMFPQALDYYFKALKIYEEINNKIGIAKVKMSIGLVYNNQLDYDKALSYYNSSLKLFEELGNVNAVGKLYNNLGILYTKQKNYEKAVVYYNRALEIRKKLGDKGGDESVTSNLAAVYFDQTDYDKAINYYFQALKINNETENKTFRAVHLSGLGNVYLSIADENNIPILKKYFDGNRKAAYQKSKVYLDSAIAIYIEMGDLHDLHPFYKSLSNAQEHLGDIQGALISYRKYVAGKDSIFSQENTKKTVEMQMQFDYDKKEREAKAEQDKKDLIVQQEIQKQKFIIGFVVLGLLFVLILAAFIFRSLRIRNKQNKIILLQKMQAEEQKQVVEEKQREILDSIRYAKRIQKSLLPTEMYLDKNLKRLQKNSGK